MSENAEEYNPMEQKQVDQEDDDYYAQPYNNREIELMQKLNQEGFFDKEEVNDFQICKPRHDLHHSVTLCRRVICRIGSTEENVAPITLKLIDLFCERSNEMVMESFCFKFLSEKVFRSYDFTQIKKSVIEKTPIEVIKNVLKGNSFKFQDEDLQAYRSESSRVVSESLNLVTFSQFDSIHDYEASESKAYKDFEGKLDRSPRDSDKKTYGSETKRCTMYDSDSFCSSPEIQIPLNDSDEDEDQFLFDEEEGYEINQLTNRISVAETWANRRFENETAKSNEEPENPLESGMLFTILFNKFNRMLTNSKTENVLLTSIFAKLASIPLSEDNPATFYLHAFIYLELK